MDAELQVAPESREMLKSPPSETAAWTEPFEEVPILAQFENPRLTGVYVKEVGAPAEVKIPTPLNKAIQRDVAGLRYRKRQEPDWDVVVHVEPEFVL